MKRHLVALLSPAILLTGVAAQAAEVTEIARPTSPDRPVGLQLMARYDMRMDTGQIAREAACRGGIDVDANNLVRCKEDSIVLNRELDYERTSHFLDLDLRVALPKRLELRVVLPIGISDQARYAYGKDVTADNSTVDPADHRIRQDLNDADAFFDTYRYFDVANGNQPPKRSGIGDMQFSLNWLAMSQEQHADFANFLLGITYHAPTGTSARGNNTGVGSGLHKLQLRLAASRQIAFVEPYFQVAWTAPFTSDSSLFGRQADSQTYIKPGQQLDFVTGLDFDLYSDKETGMSFRFGVGASLGFQSHGRDRSALFEGLAGSSCNGVTLNETHTPLTGAAYTPSPTEARAECGWLTQSPGSAANGDVMNGAFHHNGITAVESRLYFGAHARLLAQFHHNIGLQLNLGWLAYTNHIITSENTGKDYNNNGSVEMNMDPSNRERDPNYNATIDSPGRRFVLEGARQLNLEAALYVRF